MVYKVLRALFRGSECAAQRIWLDSFREQPHYNENISVIISWHAYECEA